MKVTSPVWTRRDQNIFGTDANLQKELSPLPSPNSSSSTVSIEGLLAHQAGIFHCYPTGLRVVSVQPVRTDINATVDSPLDLSISTHVDPPVTKYFHLDTPDGISAMLRGKDDSSPVPAKKEACNCTKLETLLEKQLGLINNGINNLASLMETNTQE